MRFSENWLREFVRPEQAGQELADLLTMAGLEVEALEAAAPPFELVVVGLVRTVTKHPDADRLNVCQVDVGQAAPLTIVCGAPNVAVGLHVPCALVGARLPGLVIKRAKVRGVESSGMLCSAKELGLAAESTGLMLLPEAAPGTDVRVLLDLDDRLLTLKLTPNRGDCLSLLGVAREVAALTGAPLRAASPAPVPPAVTEAPAVSIEAPDACPFYAGRVVRGVDPSVPTPDWMVRRLERCGLRSRGLLVDVTNYVMLELGQPMHAFDLAAIDGGIEVRMARAGERLLLLNGQEVTLTPDLLIIADRVRPLALAGIMGGQDSAVGGGTTDLFLEAAFFSPAAVAGRARRLGLASDAAYRFERGVDPTGARAALERAAALLAELAGGRPGPVVASGQAGAARPPIVFRPERAARLLGIDLAPRNMRQYIERVGCAIAESAEGFRVTPPGHRFDLAIEADLIEEVARLHGYDRIPAKRPLASLTMLPQPEAARPAAALRRQLMNRDYQEIISYSFVDAAFERDLAGNMSPVALLNPIASQMGVMRSTLFAGLVECLRTNLSHKQERVRLFEIGRVFEAGSGELPFDQPQRIGGLACGPVWPDQWGDAGRAVDFYDVKGDVEALAGGRTLRFEAAVHPALHPARTARIYAGAQPIGWLGDLHPRWQQQYGLNVAPVLFELDLAALQRADVPRAVTISRQPVVRRDLAVVVADSVPAAALLEALREPLTDQVTEVILFDQYRGKGIENGKKSLAFRVFMQDTQKTLTDAEVDATMKRLAAVLAERFGAVLRE